MKESGFIERNWWLIKLRWIAVAGVILTVFLADKILGVSLSVLPLYSTAVVLGAYNLLLFICLNALKRKPAEHIPAISNRLTNTQISLDLSTLTILIHFSGGIENPFIFYFIFHMIIASTSLSLRASFLQATFAVFLFCSMVVLEYFGILHHYHLGGFVTHDLYNNYVYIAGVSFVFLSTLYIAVYMATSIASKLRERERNLKEANELLNQKDRLKNEYVMRVTHDIKEHLAAIQSCIDPVTRGITGSLNEKQMNLLKRAARRVEKLIFFVKALLEVTRIKLSKQIEVKSFIFKDMLSDAVAHIASKAKVKNISINYFVESDIGTIKGAREYIQEAILNLLANSVKYTPQDGKIDIIVKDKDDSILIQIKDTGIGIPKDELPKVFDEFYRGSNAKDIERDGTGLGLSISKQIIERHNGNIWVESKESKGSTFSIVLPK
jgi:signal transduction histidine kinase